MRWNLPNILTVLRLAAAPALVAVYEVFPRPYADWLALGLFLSAALTDYLDGFLARRWKQVSNFGRMLDPIADKAMTVIALVMLAILLLEGGRVFVFPFEAPVLIGNWLFIFPVMAIIFREIFISGLREFIGSKSTGLAVTRLAKWKTTVQMVAVSVLFGHLLAEHYFAIVSFAMERTFVSDVINGLEEDMFGLRWKYATFVWTYNIGLALLWLAALLTAITGVDYYMKSLPFLKDEADT